MYKQLHVVKQLSLSLSYSNNFICIPVKYVKEMILLNQYPG